MALRGVEWIVAVYEVAILVVPVYAFIALRRRIRHKGLTKIRAFWYYIGFVISPVALYALFFLSMVGIEEVTKMSMITEGLARSVLSLIGLGLVVWLISSIIFMIALSFIGHSTSSIKPRVDRTP